MFTASITSWYDNIKAPVELGTFATGGAALKATKEWLEQNPAAFRGEVYSVRHGAVLFSATNPCPEWVR